MDRVRTRIARGLEQPRYRQVTLGRWRRSNGDRAIGRKGVRRAGISLRVDGNALDPELAARADDPHGNLAAIRDQQAADHVDRRFNTEDTKDTKAETICPKASLPLCPWCPLYS